jgi:hypothetical protein
MTQALYAHMNNKRKKKGTSHEVPHPSVSLCPQRQGGTWDLEFLTSSSNDPCTGEKQTGLRNTSIQERNIFRQPVRHFIFHLTFSILSCQIKNYMFIKYNEIF